MPSAEIRGTIGGGVAEAKARLSQPQEGAGQVSRVYLLVLVEDAFDFFGDPMPRSATESSRALLSRRGPGRCRGSAADPRRRRHERPRPSEATATHAAIVKPGTPDRSRRRARRAICGTAGRRTLGPPRGIGRRGRRAQARKTLSVFRGTEGSSPPPSTSGAALISNSFLVRCPRSRPRWRRHPCLNFAVSSTWSLRRSQSSLCTARCH